MPVDGHIGIDSFGIKAGGHSAERNVSESQGPGG